MTNLKLDPVDNNPPGPPHNPSCNLQPHGKGYCVMYSVVDDEPKTEAIRTDTLLNLLETV